MTYDEWHKARVDDYTNTVCIPLTKGRHALIDIDDFQKVSAHKWQAHKNTKTLFYATKSMTINGKKLSIKMHRLIMEPPKNKVIDHINGNPLDNRKINMRITEQAGNCRNRSIDRRNKSGFKGVNYVNEVGKYRATICLHNKKINLGYYEDRSVAAYAYNIAAQALHGEFAKINVLPLIPNISSYIASQLAKGCYER